MRIKDTPLDPEVEELAEDRLKRFVSLGSDVAVSPHAPVVTGDPAMDTQLENMRGMLCDRVWAMYRLTTRVKQIRLWAQEVLWDGGAQSKVIPASLVKKDDHPLVATLIEQAKDLQEISQVSCMAYPQMGGEPYLCSKLQLNKIQTRMKLMAEIRATIAKLEEAGQQALDKAGDLIKHFHSMAQAFRIHREKLDAAGVDVSDSELIRIAAQAKAPGGSLEAFIDPK